MDGQIPAGLFRKNVLLFMPHNLTFGSSGVFTPNLMGMDKLRRSEEQFKSGVNFHASMSEIDVRRKLEQVFPVLINQSFWCAARSACGNARLDFDGNQRVWDGNTIKRRLRGNSALYIVLVDQQHPLIPAIVPTAGGRSESGISSTEESFSPPIDVARVLRSQPSSRGQEPSVTIHPNKGPIEGGTPFSLRLNNIQLGDDAVDYLWAVFERRQAKVVKYSQTASWLGETPPGDIFGTVLVTVMTPDGHEVGVTQYTYVDEDDDAMERVVNSPRLQWEVFNEFSSQQSTSQGSAENNSTDSNDLGLYQQGRLQRPVNVLRCLVYTAARIGVQQFIRMVFSTSAGRIVYDAYKNESLLPEDIAIANGHNEIAVHLQEINDRFSKEDGSNQTESKEINWQELVRAVEESEIRSSCKTDTKDLLKVDVLETVYFGDAEPSSSDSDKEIADLATNFSEEYNPSKTKAKDDESSKNVGTRKMEDEAKVKDVGSDERDEKTAVRDEEIKIEDVGSDITQGKTGVEDGETKMEDVGRDASDNKPSVTDKETKMEDVGSDARDEKATIRDKETKMEDVASDPRDEKARVTDKETKIEDVGSDARDEEATLTDEETKMEDVGSDARDEEARVSDEVKKMQDVGSDARAEKTVETNEERGMEDVVSDARDEKTGVTDEETKLEDSGSAAKEMKSGGAEMKKLAENIRSDVKDVNGGVIDDTDAKKNNYFRFSILVLEEFPVALRQVFVYMWNSPLFSPARLYPAKKWDDSEEVRNLFSNEEGEKSKVPTNKSYEKWDCATLLEATLFAKTFGKPDTSGNRRPLNQLHVKRLSPGAFHTRVQSRSLFQSQPETFALALDQLRLLRNALCRHISTQTIDKESFDRYISLAKDAFTALKQDSTTVTAVEHLREEHFSTGRRQQLEEELRREKDAALTFSQMEVPRDGLIKPQVDDVQTRKGQKGTKLENARSAVKEMKSGGTEMKKTAQNIRSDIKDVNGGVTDAKKNMEDVGSDVGGVKAGVADVKTSAGDVRSNVKDVKNGAKYVKTKVEDDKFGVKEMQTQQKDVKRAKVDDTESGLRDVKTALPHVHTKDVGLDVKDVKTGGNEAMKKEEDVESEKTGVTGVTAEEKAQVENVESDLKKANTFQGNTDVSTKVGDVESEVRRLRAGETDSQANDKNVLSHLASVKMGTEADVKKYLKTNLKNSQLAVRNKNVNTEEKERMTIKGECWEALGARDVKTKSENVRFEVKNGKVAGPDKKTTADGFRWDARAGVADVKTKMEDVVSDVKDVKIGQADVKTKMEDVGSDVKDEKIGQADVKTKMEDVGSDVKDVKTGQADVKTKMEDVGLDVKEVFNAVTGLTNKVEDVAANMETSKNEVGSYVKEITAKVDAIQQEVQAGISKGPFVPESCIPNKIPHFVGRQEELQTLADHLTNENTRVVAVWGSPGFGKTSVANTVAHYLREDMKIPVYFVPLRGTETIEDLVSKLLSMFTDFNQMPHLSPAHSLIQSLQSQKNPFVLILDNADDLLESENPKRKQKVVGFIEEILAQCKHIKLLLTTRESLDFLSLKLQIHLEKINALDDHSSARLVTLLLSDVSQDDGRYIIKACWQVPLAIRLMCSVIKEENVSISELQKELKNSPIVEVLDEESFPDDTRLKKIINTSFQKLSARERKAFVSLAVFPGWFGIEEAKAVLDPKTDRTTTKIIRSLERKSLIDCEDNFSRFTIHSLLRSFIDEQKDNDEADQATFLLASHRFYDYYISSFRDANNVFLMGPSNQASAAFIDRRQSILSSLQNGTRNDEFYPKIVEVLSKAELFLCAVLPGEEALFEELYDTAVQEARRRQIVEDERRLLASKSLMHWAWFSPNHQTWDPSLYVGCNSDADAECPAKLLCYHAVHLFLCGKPVKGLSLFKRSFVRLNNHGDELIIKCTAGCLFRKHFQEHQLDDGMELQGNNLECLVESWLKARFPFKNSAGKYRIDRPDAERLLMDDVLFTCLLSTLLGNERGEDDDLEVFSKVLCRVSPAMSRNLRLAGQDIHPMLIVQYHILKDPDASQVLKSKELLSDKKLKPLLLGLQEFTEEIVENGINSAKSYNATKLFMNSLLHSEINAKSFLEKDADDFYEHVCNTFENVLKARTNVPDIDLIDLAKCYDQLGRLKWLQGDKIGAIESHQQAIRLRKGNIGDHVDTVSSMKRIGSIYLEIRNTSEATKALESALKLRKRLGVRDYADTSSVFFTLGKNHNHQSL